MTDRADNGRGAPTPSFGELARLFVNRRDVKFWQTEGLQHAHLFWVRAMLSEEVEPPPLVPRAVTMPQLDADYRRFAQARQQIYGFLARAFEYPDDDFLADITTPAYVENLVASLRLLADNDETNEGATLWLQFAESAGAPAGRFGLSPLREDYTRMIYDSNLPCIPPYESVFHNERQVMGKQAGAVTDFYHQAGLGVTGHEMPDHIALECEFVAHLAGKEAEARENGQLDGAAQIWETEQRFLTAHLLTWGGKFCADLHALARADFYRAVARLGAGLFNDELVRLTSEM